MQEDDGCFTLIQQLSFRSRGKKNVLKGIKENMLIKSKILVAAKKRIFMIIRSNNISGKTKRRISLNYDPKSYADNFDNGDYIRETDGPNYPDFASRFAAPHRQTIL